MSSGGAHAPGRWYRSQQVGDHRHIEARLRGPLDGSPTLIGNAAGTASVRSQRKQGRSEQLATSVATTVETVAFETRFRVRLGKPDPCARRLVPKKRICSSVDRVATTLEANLFRRCAAGSKAALRREADFVVWQPMWKERCSEREQGKRLPRRWSTAIESGPLAL